MTNIIYKMSSAHPIRACVTTAHLFCTSVWMAYHHLNNEFSSVFLVLKILIFFQTLCWQKRESPLVECMLSHGLEGLCPDNTMGHPGLWYVVLLTGPRRTCGLRDLSANDPFCEGTVCELICWRRTCSEKES